ncbi:MAG: sugar transferase [Clostridia bacterium]|nr:sugar transferase [Bacilli bacterium]MBR3511532.1 sugar transferase [Clostridia bacterium]
MKLKDRFSWIKHLDFILIDLLCLMVAFIIAYFIRFEKMNLFEDREWSVLFLIICFVNLVVTFLTKPYSGILRRRYYLQLNKEIILLVNQVAFTCVLFYALKIGTFFSRTMIFIMYFVYFALSQISKYIRKKKLTGELPLKRREIIIKVENTKGETELDCIDKRSKISKLVSSFIKRTFDIIGALLGCLILIPLTAFVFVLNKLNEEDDGPIFYIQDRIGKDGKIFKMFKYRSMVVDADEKLEEFLAENEDVKNEFKIYRKLKNDPRVTKVGKFLRNTSLDEMPQFINVLKGDMSIIGPRPYLWVMT